MEETYYFSEPEKEEEGMGCEEGTGSTDRQAERAGNITGGYIPNKSG